MKYIAMLLLLSTCFANATPVVVGTNDLENLIPFSAQMSCRWQTLLLQSDINYQGNIVEVEFYQRRSNTFKLGTEACPFTVLMCHTTKTSLDESFSNNYVGTPVEVLKMLDYQIIPGNEVWRKVGITGSFPYSSSYNLLIEIKHFSYGQGNCYVGYTTTGENVTTIFANRWFLTKATHTYKYHLYTRLTFLNTGINPTSLGRVKALYR